MVQILVIDDEPGILRFVKRALEADGHTVETATNGSTGLQMAFARPPDLVILDLAMPGIPGLSVLAALMENDPRTRVIVLSAVGDMVVRVRCLDAGAADFLAKPFALRELLARVRARVREPGRLTEQDADVIECGQLRLDVRRRTLHMNGRGIDLSQREFMLLQHLMSKPDAVCTREELLSEVWGYGFDPGTNVVDVYIRRLRQKLNGDVIDTVRNVGYSLRPA